MQLEMLMMMHSLRFTHNSQCSFSMMFKWTNYGLLQANDGKMLVNDGEMLVNDGEMLVNNGEMLANDGVMSIW